MPLPLRYALAAGGLLLAAATGARANCTITVSHADDMILQGTITGDRDNKINFREAAEIGLGNARCYSDFEKARISGGNFVADPVFCLTVDTTLFWRLSLTNPGCGPNDADTIRFADAMVGGNTVRPFRFVLIDPRDGIQGDPPTAGFRPFIALDGSSQVASETGALFIFSVDPVPASGTFKNLYFTNFKSFAIRAPRVDGLKVFGVNISGLVPGGEYIGSGINLGALGPGDFGNPCAFNAQIGGTGAGEQNYIYGISGDAIRISDYCGDTSDRNNKVFNNYIGICEALDTGAGLEGCADGTPNQAIGGSGVHVESINGTRVGGAGTNEGNFIGRAAGAGVLISGSNASGNLVRGNRIGLSRQGEFARGNVTGVAVNAGADNNTIGGGGGGEGNTIGASVGSGVLIDGAGTSNNVVQGNVIGLNSTRTQARGNGGDGVAIINGPDGVVVSNNVISANAGWGVLLRDGNGYRVENNVIGLRGPANNANDNSAAGNGAGGVALNSPNNLVGPGNRIASNNGPGVWINGEGADGNRIFGNMIGLSAGNNLRPNANQGVFIQGGADATVVGGSVIADRNTISGNNGAGVYVIDPATTGTQLRFNYIGTDPSGAGAFGNSGAGVDITGGASGSVVRQNLVSANGNGGIRLEGGASGTSVTNNQVGVNAAGTVALPNGASGIALLSGAAGNDIGDPLSPFGLNVIAGNAGAGIFVSDNGTNNNRIVGNIIGAPGFANATGIILTAGAQGNQLTANAIRANTGAGVAVLGATTLSNPIRDNQISANGTLGIDLGGDGVTANDAGDADTGPNTLQNFPTLSNVVRGGNMVSMLLSLSSINFSTFGLQAFWSFGCDPIGNGEGENLLGSINAVTAANGTSSVNAMFPLADGTNANALSATATNPGASTSEFSPCVAMPNLAILIFANGFENAALNAEGDMMSAEGAPSIEAIEPGTQVRRLDRERVALSFGFANRGPWVEPAHAFRIGADRGVVIESIEAEGAACALGGAIECRVAELAAGKGARVRVVLNVGPEPLGAWIESDDGGRTVLDVAAAPLQ